MTSERDAGTADLFGRVLGVLATCISALERGDWRTVLVLVDTVPLAGRRDVVNLAGAVLRLADSMRLQAINDVSEAASAIRVATSMLAERSREAHPQVLHLSARTSRVARRERIQLDELRGRFVELDRGQPELVEAATEHLTWVIFDPWTVRRHPHERRLLGLDDAAFERFGTLNRTCLCDRATRLRHFATQRTRPVSEKNWSRLGAERGVFESALWELASQDLHSPKLTGVPVRLGRLRAWDYARRWRVDIGHG
jgi:hypothetical protein